MNKLSVIGVASAFVTLSFSSGSSLAADVLNPATRITSLLNNDGLVMPLIWCAQRGDNSLRVAFYSIRYLSDGRANAQIKLSFDNGPLFTFKAHYGNHIAVPEPSIGNAEADILERLRSSRFVVIQLQTDGALPITDRFSLDDAKDRIIDTARQCDDLKWRLRGPIRTEDSSGTRPSLR